jgi:hypothetical protein
MLCVCGAGEAAAAGTQLQREKVGSDAAAAARLVALAARDHARLMACAPPPNETFLNTLATKYLIY